MIKNQEIIQLAKGVLEAYDETYPDQPLRIRCLHKFVEGIASGLGKISGLIVIAIPAYYLYKGIFS